jgi:fructose-1,6-bisphosphatase/inositol monophosphatase family enzyme
VVAGEALGAIGADLAMVLQGRLGQAGFSGLWDFAPGDGVEVRVEGAGTLRQHAGQISMEGEAAGNARIAAGASGIYLKALPVLPLGRCAGQS